MLVFYLAALDSDDDKNKFEYIYRKYYRFMLHTAAGIIKNPTLAEDAVHETFVQLLRGIDTLRIDNERALKSYLYMVTRERSIDFLRKWERRRGAQPDYESLIDRLKNAELGTGFNAATGEWVNMIEAGIIDPVKVSRSALQNAASVASLILTTEAVVANKPEPAPAAPAMDPGMMGY